MKRIGHGCTDHVLKRRNPVPNNKYKDIKNSYIQCQNLMRLARGWKTPAKINVRENMREVIIAAVGALGVYTIRISSNDENTNAQINWAKVLINNSHTIKNNHWKTARSAGIETFFQNPDDEMQ